MHLIRSYALSAALGLTAVVAHAQFQVVHDAPNSATTVQLTPLLLTDGNTVTHHWNAGQHIFRKYDANGALLWTRALEGTNMPMFYGDNAIALMSDGADGFRYIRPLAIIYTQVGEEPWEATWEISYEIGNVSGAGVLDAVYHLRKTYAVEAPGAPYFDAFDAVRTPDNGLVLISTFSDSALGRFEVVKVASNGTVEWARSVGRTFNGIGPDPTWSFDTEPNASLAVSSSGRIYYTEGGRFNSNLRLAELSSTGDMLWMKKYVYANIPPAAEFNNIAVGADGRVHAGGYISTSVGRFHMFLRSDPDGNLDRGDLYRTPNSFGGGQFGIDDQGRRLQRVNVYAPGGVQTQGILLADTLGSAATFLRRDDQVIAPNNVFLVPRKIDVSGDRLAMSGLLYHEHMDLAFTTRYETLTTLTTDMIASCVMDDTTFAHIPIPMSIMTTVDVPDAVSIDVSAYYTSEPVSLSFTTVAPDPVEPFCAFVSEIIGIELGVGDAAQSDDVPLVLNTLVPQGAAILLNDGLANAVDVYDVHGALVQHSNLGGDRAISTAGWSSGVYIIHALDSKGLPFRAGRVVVE